MKPQHKYCSWSKDGYALISKELKKEVKTIEHNNHVCINFIDKKHAVVVYGLNAAEISSTEIHFRTFVESKLQIESPIPVTRYESLFLRKKYNTSLKELCFVRFPAASDFQNGSAPIILKGVKAKVEAAIQRINEAINNLKVEEIKFRHDSYGEMWKRKWTEVKTQQESTHDVMVNVYMVLDKKDASYRTPADMGGTVELAVIGKHDDTVNKVECAIKDVGTTLLQKTRTLTKEHLKAVLEGLKSKNLKFREDHNTEVVLNWDYLTLEFITPNGSVEDSDAALNAYLQGVVISKEIIVANNSSLVVFLKKIHQWQQIVAIAKQHAVTVKLVNNGIDIRGKSDDIANARKSVKDKLQEYLKSIKSIKVPVDVLMSPIMNTPKFESIVSKFKQEYGVTVSHTKCSTICSIKLKTPYDSFFTIDICVGNICTETSDAIVNVANCNLQHTEGLAKEMVNAGGSIIQKESNDYIEKHGTVNQCEAVCLGSGDLKCGKIIHCVPPLWVDGNQGEAKDVSTTVTNCLLCAEDCLTRTILIPSFPCGPSGVSEYAGASLKAVLNLCSSGVIKCLSSVRFILLSFETAEEYEKQLQILQPTSQKLGHVQKAGPSVAGVSEYAGASVNAGQVEVILQGPKQSLDKAENEINRFFESIMVSEEISLSAALSSGLIDDICKKCNIKYSDLSSNKVILKGLERNVTKATLEIKDILLQDYSKAESYPDEWELQNEEPLELKLLAKGSPEWSKVSQQFLATLPSTNIVKIERVQNKWLWEKYRQHSDRMKRKNEGVINEKLLFHGTRGTSPSCIYQDEEGFDMRFSNAGMWGNGNYFAVNASYSHGYAHPLPDGMRQMFLAKVLTGYSYKCSPNRSLRMPPVRKQSPKGGDMRYDTVNGETGGSQVFIAYSNEKAYPFYLISYK